MADDAALTALEEAAVRALARIIAAELRQQNAQARERESAASPRSAA